jgi:hypothetical protein
MPIIAFTGLPRVGKTIATDYLTKKYNDAVSYAFALPIKKALCELFGWKLEDFDNDDKDKLDPYWKVSKRQMMEYIGTMIMRGDIRQKYPLFEQFIGENIWVNRAKQFMAEHKQKVVLLSDLRFMPEYIMLREVNATIIKIERPNYKVDESRCYAINSMTFDKIIYNRDEGNIQQFYNDLSMVYEGIVYGN